MALSTGIAAMLLAFLTSAGVWFLTGTFTLWLLIGLGFVFFAGILTLRLMIASGGKSSTIAASRRDIPHDDHPAERAAPLP